MGAKLIPRRYWFVALGIVAVMATVLLLMGRNPICPCGTLRLWTGDVNGPENSQQLADWYVPSHIIHGFLFYLAGWLLLGKRTEPGHRLILATCIEAAWELIENSPMVIERYREATIALGYTGDSAINSISDVGWMMLGFGLARRLPVWGTVALAVAFELFTLIMIRDNLTLNVIMLLAPNDAIRAWQAGG
ncbi:DUF2585 domain-containing protein [Allosphingosinicella sp.]|uniref:DUF2585 domain-containing protein n=1 Tax=Allosphingosinicella sp. TaxID=2823234 RepID=UPI003784C4CB